MWSNSYCKMTKKDIVKKVIGTGAGLALGVLPLVSNAQDYNKLQKGVNAATYEGETPTHYIYHFGFNKDLQKAIKGATNPQIYLTGDKNSYIVVDPDTSGYKLYYFKENFDKSGNSITKPAVTLRGDWHDNPCFPDVPGSKNNALASFFWGPSKLPKQPTEEVRELPETQPGNISYITINKDSHDVYNYFYGDTSKKTEEPKPSPLEFRILAEGFKNVNGPYFGATINPQFVFGKILGIGPYATARFGSENESTTEHVYNKILLSQPAQIFTETEGVRTGNSKLTYPSEFGGALSLNTKDDLFRMDLAYGLVNKNVSKSGIQESGFDRKLQGDNIIEEKPYGPISIEQGKKYNTWIPTQKIGFAIQPSQKVPIYLKAEAQHIGKVNSMKKGNVHYNVGIGGNIGWRKR